MPDAAEQSEPGCCVSRPIEVTIEPGWSAWRAALEKHKPDPARRQLGIPTDRPVVFSGHQPIVFHPGILAKLVAQHEAARRTGAARVWIVADQDPVNPAQIRVPKGIGAALHAETINLLPPDYFQDGIASASLPARSVFAHGKVSHGLSDFADELNMHLGDLTQMESDEIASRNFSIARQFAEATISSACSHLLISIPKLIFASELFSSDTLWGIVERMLADPHACVKAYNEAVARYPEARVRPLEINDSRVELPLWGLRIKQPRVAITTDNFHDYARAELTPRGLFMSLLVRAQLGEIFIHGTGGWIYDNITQDWARDWLEIELAPMALATATQRLDLGFSAKQMIDPDRALWEAHHARHNPAALGDMEAQRKKDMCLKHIEAMKEHDEDPSEMFRKMHGFLEEYREHYADALREFEERVRVARSMQKQIELANDRTWPFVLFSDEQLSELKRAVVDAMHEDA